MEAYQIIFNILLYFSEGLILFYYADSFFERKYSALKTVLCVSAFHIALFGIYYLDNTILNLAALFAAYCLVFSLLYKCKILSSIFNSTLLLAVMWICEWAVLFITTLFNDKDFNAYQYSPAVRIFDTTLSKLAYYLVCLILIRLFSKQIKNKQNKAVYWQLMIMPVSSLAAIFAFRYITSETALTNKANIICSVVSLLLLFANIVVFLVYEHAINTAAELYELRAIRQKQETEKQYLDILEQNNKDLKIFTHDIKNHLEQIGNIAENDEVTKYISGLYGTINQYGNTVISGNKTLDIILSKYNTLCANKSISITVKVREANLSDIDDSDLSTILNNALDNAVEAAEKSAKKQIFVDIYSHRDFEVVKIQNSCDTAPKTSDQKLLTAKPNKDLHGLGYESIVRTVKRYRGIPDWVYDEENKIFELTVAIPINK